MRNPSLLKRLPALLVAHVIVLFARFVTAVRANWQGVAPVPEQRVYFANHVSHGDFVLVWTVLTDVLRKRTRPVAGADYWLASPLRRFIGEQVFNAVLIDRERKGPVTAPVEYMSQALQQGDSLILFPEGTRNTGDELLLPFKSGLYHLARANPSVDLVPVWISNLHRVLPKGEFIPVPLACQVYFGGAIRLDDQESKERFLLRAESALKALADSAAQPGDSS